MHERNMGHRLRDPNPISPVVVVGEVLDALEVEGLDDAVGAEVVLGASLGRLDGRPLHARAVDLGDPEAEAVELAVDGGRHSEVHCHLG